MIHYTKFDGQFEFLAGNITRRYDPENDVPSPYCHPAVTHTDMALLTLIVELSDKIKELEQEKK